MAAKVSTVRTSTPGKNLGKFHCRYFNMFDKEDIGAYQGIRQRDNDSSDGLTIDLIREFVRKVRDETRKGEDIEIHEEEFPYVYIEWWEKKSKKKDGDSHEEQKSAKAGWSD